MKDQDLINTLNNEIEQEIKETRIPFQYGITSYDKELLKAINDKYKLKKIAVTGLLAVGIIILPIGTIVAKKHSSGTQLATTTEIENNFDQNELPTLEQLTQYSIAVEEYLDLMDIKDHDQYEEVIKRMEVVKQTRELTNAANFLMREKVKECFNITDQSTEINIFREETTDQVNDYIIISKDNEELYRTTKVPKEVRKILDYQEEIVVYNGSGENKAWEQGIQKFIKFGGKLYSSIIKLSEKEFYLDGTDLKSREAEQKSI